MSKVADFLFDPFGLVRSRARKKAEKKVEKTERKVKRKAKVLSDQAFSESSSLLGGRAGSTQVGTLLGG